MERVNVTLSMPSALVNKVRQLAIMRNMSLSELTRQLFEREFDPRRSPTYESSKEAALELMRKGFHMGPMEPFDRDKAHER